MADIPLQCHCGAVKGIAKEISPASGNRLVCYCNSCQTFARHLEKMSQAAEHPPTLDADGGTEVFQLPPTQLHIAEGHEHIACLRLSPKGTYRWYTTCCQTPIGNTLTAGVPFIGLIHSFIQLTDTERQQALGNVQGYIHAKHATGNRMKTSRHQGMPPLLGIKLLMQLLLWKLRGFNQPSPLFDSQGTPLAVPHVINTRDSS